MKRQKRRQPVPYFLLVPGLMLALAVHFMAPLAGAAYAFTNFSGVGSYKFIGLANFREIFSSREERGAFNHTLMLAIAFVLLVNIIGFGLAFSLSTYRRGGSALRAAFFVPAVMSPFAVSQVWRYLLNYRGPVNHFLQDIGLSDFQRNWVGDPRWSLWTILLVMVWQYSGYAMVIYTAGLASIPKELADAARVDGATAWKQLRFVTWPLLAPALTITTTLMTITGLRVFDQVLGLTGGGPSGSSETLASEFYTQAFVNGRFGFGTSIALILTAFVTVIGIGQVLILRAREGRY